VRTTLETLRISDHFYHWCGTEYENPHPTFGIKGVLHSLKDFEELVEVEVPFSLLLCSDQRCDASMAGNLPPNIQSLILRDDVALYRVYPWRSGDVLKQLPEYLRFWSIHNPNFARLLNESRRNWDESALSAFRNLCRRMCIMPNIHKKPWDHSWPGSPVFATGRF